jgi:hypothetical protein
LRITRYGEIRGCVNTELRRDTAEGKRVTAAETGVQLETEIERIEAWRSEELQRAGYDAVAAEKLAVRHDVDLHVAADLLRQGCSQDLALEILL